MFTLKFTTLDLGQRSPLGKQWWHDNESHIFLETKRNLYGLDFQHFKLLT